jgi:hypothetical protein
MKLSKRAFIRRLALGGSLLPGLVAIAGCAEAGTAGIAEVPEFQAEIVAEFEVANARQGVAVDRDYFYAVTNFAISKHDKASGELVASWEGAAEGDPLIHMDSLVALDGRLIASHSNYSIMPMTSSVEIWNSDDMTHVDTHSFGINRGSLTWLDWHNGQWWGGFANYDKIQKGQTEPYGTTNRTQVVRFDEDFVVLEAWTLPLEILDRMRPMSNSGGSWGADGYLYLTGHDHGELYVMEIPEFGSELHWVATVNVPTMEGQGIAWDRSTDEPILWAIYKKERKVLKIRMPEVSE